MNNTSFPEPFVPGEYELMPGIDQLFIRPAMDSTVKDVGSYFKGNTFSVYEVMPETKGIVWGRVSSNVTGGLRFVGMRVNNNRKVKLMKAFTQEPIPTSSLLEWARAADAWMRLNGFKGPKPE